jgi:deoxyhypusine monooxygenase
MTTLAQPETIKEVGQVLRDKTKPLKDRFRALFTLRNLGGKDSIDHITSCFDDESALLKHELAYCLGQMQDEYAIPALVSVLKDTNQEAMVRHEAGKYFDISIIQKYMYMLHQERTQQQPAQMLSL